jgi:hypothetical protein
MFRDLEVLVNLFRRHFLSKSQLGVLYVFVEGEEVLVWRLRVVWMLDPC